MLAKKGKRAIASALALIMTLGTLPGTAFAVSEEEHSHNAFNSDGFYYDCTYTEGEEKETLVCGEEPNVHVHDGACEIDAETGDYLCGEEPNTHEHSEDCYKTERGEGTWDCTAYPYYTVTFTDEISGETETVRLVPDAPEFSEEIPAFEAPEGMTFDGWLDEDGAPVDPASLAGDAALTAAWSGGEPEQPEEEEAPGEQEEAMEPVTAPVDNGALMSGEELSYTLSGMHEYWDADMNTPRVGYEDLGTVADMTLTAPAGEHISPESLVIAPVGYEEWYFLFNGVIKGMHRFGIKYWDDIEYFILREGKAGTQLWAKYAGEERQITNPAEQLCAYTDWAYSFEDLDSTGVEYAYSVDDQTVVEMATDKLYCFNSQEAYERAIRVNPELEDSIAKFEIKTGISFFAKAGQGYFPVAGKFTGLSGTQKGEIHPLNNATSGAEAEALAQGYSHQFYYHEFKSDWSKGYGIRGFQLMAEEDNTRYTITYYNGETELTDLNDGGIWNTKLTIKDYAPGGGKTLLGWSTTDGGEVRYHAGDTYTVMGENLNLYAVLGDDDTKYTVTYYNGDTALPNLTQEGTWGDSLTIQDFTAEGYDFLGWSTEKGSETVAYQANATYTVQGESLKLYAVLKEQTVPAPDVRITLVAPGDGVVGVPFWYGIKVWNIGTATAEKAVVTDKLPEGLELDVSSLKAEIGTVSYDSASRTLTWTVENLKAQSSEPLKTQLRFSAIAQAAGTYKNTVALEGSAFTSSVTTEFVETDKPVENVTLSYYWNDGVHSEAIDTQSVRKGSSVTVRTGDDLSRADYTFLGWAYDKAAKKADLAGGGSVILDGNIDLYAVWAPRAHYGAQFFLRLDSTIQKEDGTTGYHRTYYTPHGSLKGDVYKKRVSVDGIEGLITNGIEKGDLSALEGKLGDVKAAIRTLPNDGALRKTVQTYFDVTDEELKDGTVGVLWYVVKDGKDNCPNHVDGVLYRLNDSDKPTPVEPKESSIEVIHEYYQSVDGAPAEKVGASQPATVDTLDGAKIIVGQKIDVSKLTKVTTFEGHEDYAYTKYAADSLTVPAEGTLTITLKYLRGVTTYAVSGEKVVSGLTSLPAGYAVTLALMDGEIQRDTLTLTAADFTQDATGNFRADFTFQARVEAGTYTVKETGASSVSGYNGPAVRYQLDVNKDGTVTTENTNQVTVGSDETWKLVISNTYTVINNGGGGNDDNDNDRDDRPAPTPTPSVRPDPTTPPDGGDNGTGGDTGEVIIPDEDVPLGDLPEEEIVVDDPQIPLGDTPEGGEGTETVIIDEGTPLGNLPQTGTMAQPEDPTITRGLLAVSLSLAAAGLWLLRKKEEENA